MRDKHRIEPFLIEFGELWKKYPDLRFGQLVMNLQATISKNPDPFYTEDDQMLQAIHSFGAKSDQEHLEQMGIIPDSSRKE